MTLPSLLRLDADVKDVCFPVLRHLLGQQSAIVLCATLHKKIVSQLAQRAVISTTELLQNGIDGTVRDLMGHYLYFKV